MNTTKGFVKSRTQELLERLKKRIESVKSSDEFKAYLNAMAIFHSYSLQNTLLIAIQHPSATRVAGYKKWQALGRQVRSGETGIAILAPIRVKSTKEKGEGENPLSEEEEHLFFRPVFVFDVSQTEGAELPSIKLPQMEDTHRELFPRLLRFCRQRNIVVELERLGDKVHGISTLGKIIINLDLNQTEKGITMIHELAHEMIHATKETRLELRNEQKEMEAEATAFVVSTQLGLPETGSDKYLALYQKSYDLHESLAAIHKASHEILQAVDPFDPVGAV